MADVLISQLPAAGAVADTDLFEIEQGITPTNTSGKRTWLEIKNAILAILPAPRDTVTALSNVAGTVTLNAALGDYFTLTLAANVTTLTITNPPAAGKGMTLTINLLQNGTGGFTFALPSSFKATGGSDTAIQLAANSRTKLIISSVDQGVRWEYAMQEVTA